MTDTTTPRCPSCGAAMKHTTIPFARYSEWICDNRTCEKFGWLTQLPDNELPEFTVSIVLTTPARVPCPACEGEGTLTLRYPCGEWVDEVVYPCTLCHNSGDVTSALAAAWTADGNSVRSAGKG